MTGLQRDRLTGAILLAVAIIWLAGVYWTVPGAPGETQIGPRGFPLAMGCLLALLATILIVGSLRKAEDAIVVPHDTQAHREATSSQRWALLATFGFLVLYALALDAFGFLLSTIVLVAAFLFFVLRERSPSVLLGVPLGLSFGIWLILNKLMGVYLPKGSLMSWF